jgi:hypothetical protein
MLVKVVHKQRHPFIFWRILTIRTPYQRELFHKFRFSIQNQNPTTPVQSALFFKVQNQN